VIIDVTYGFYILEGTYCKCLSVLDRGVPIIGSADIHMRCLSGPCPDNPELKMTVLLEYFEYT